MKQLSGTAVKIYSGRTNLLIHLSDCLKEVQQLFFREKSGYKHTKHVTLKFSYVQGET